MRIIQSFGSYETNRWAFLSTASTALLLQAARSTSARTSPVATFNMNW